jgi:hypothetical protein
MKPMLWTPVLKAKAKEEKEEKEEKEVKEAKEAKEERGEEQTKALPLDMRNPLSFASDSPLAKNARSEMIAGSLTYKLTIVRMRRTRTRRRKRKRQRKSPRRVKPLRIALQRRKEEAQEG